MKIHDLSGSFETDNAIEIVHRLRSVRSGFYGAFHITGDHDLPCIPLHFNGNTAYIHYFPAEDHPGWQPTNMTPLDCPDNVHFLNTDGTEAGSFDMPASTLVDADTAIEAILEFAASLEIPRSIKWFEL